MKLENLRKERDHWRKRAEKRQRLQDKKEEAWDVFQRQPRLGPKRREEFEREYKQNVTAGPRTHHSAPTNKRRSLCRSGWTNCARTLWQKTEGRKPENAGEWSMRTPTHNGVNHGTSCASEVFCHHFRERPTELRREIGRRARCIRLLSGDKPSIFAFKISRSKWVLINSQISRTCTQFSRL